MLNSNFIFMAVDKNSHLSTVLETHRMCHVDDFVKKMISKREEIKSKMTTHYGDIKYSAFNSGSMAKHTATNIKFDMDVIEPFKHDSFDTLQAMFDDVYNFLHEEYQDSGIAKVRKQKVSVGIEFPVEDGDDKPIQIDVVPGRELSDHDYMDSHDLNLCFNEDHWGFKKGTSQKTNIKKQIDHISGKSDERKIIRLLKIWKKHHEKEYKSFVLELITIRALDGYNGDKSLWGRLKYTMEYIRDHVNDDSFHLYDPGNSNNDVIASMDKVLRQNLSNEMSTMLTNIEARDNYLTYYFPVNEKYVEKEEKEASGFGLKPNRSGYSNPSTSQRFG